MSSLNVDVCILGAGMAGLTLARQLQRAAPDLHVALVEHRSYPVPESAHKVGESTVEIAAHYLAEDLGLKAHMTDAQLPKFGLRLFLRGEEPIADDLARYDEVGASKVLPIPTYQIDRGRLENYLAADVAANGADLLSGATLREVALKPGAHRVRVRSENEERHVQARYLVDTSGRRAWLRNQLELGRDVRHTNHAVWYRTDAEFDLDGWSGDAGWRARCHGEPRRLSTNHFSGPGYWLWLIPLASGCTSVGLVFDARLVDVKTVNTHDKLLNWLHIEHPLVAERLRDHPPLDFHVLQDYAVSSKEVFSADGWMLSGDAGVFADPFYSPGADFIAFANGFATELITKGGDVERWQKYQRYFLTFFSNTMSLYRGQYAGFGNRNLMVLKTLWDYTYYWGPLAKLFFSRRYLDLEFMQNAQDDLLRASALNSGMQGKFRKLAKLQERVGGEGRFFDHHAIPLFHTMKEQLLAGDSVCMDTELRDSVATLQALAALLDDLLQRTANGETLPPLEEMGQLPVLA